MGNGKIFYTPWVAWGEEGADVMDAMSNMRRVTKIRLRHHEKCWTSMGWGKKMGGRGGLG